MRDKDSYEGKFAPIACPRCRKIGVPEWTAGKGRCPFCGNAVKHKMPVKCRFVLLDEDKRREAMAITPEAWGP